MNYLKFADSIDPEIVEFLIKSGNSVNLKNKKGETCISIV